MNSIDFGDEFLKLIQKWSDKKWDWYLLSENECFEWSHVQRHSHLPWDFDGLSANPNITMEIMMKHPEHPWNFEVFQFYSESSDDSWSPSFTTSATRDRNARQASYLFSSDSNDWSLYRSNPWIWSEEVARYPDRPWDWIYWSYHSHLTLHLVESFPDKPWDMNRLCANTFPLERQRRLHRQTAHQFSYQILEDLVRRYYTPQRLYQSLFLHDQSVQDWADG